MGGEGSYARREKFRGYGLSQNLNGKTILDRRNDMEVKPVHVIARRGVLRFMLARKLSSVAGPPAIRTKLSSSSSLPPLPLTLIFFVISHPCAELVGMVHTVGTGVKSPPDNPLFID